MLKCRDSVTVIREPKLEIEKLKKGAELRRILTTGTSSSSATLTG